MFTIDGYNYEFRVKEMNAIEILALRTQLDFENVEDAQKFFNQALRRIEVKAGENWVPCFEMIDVDKNIGVYYPEELGKNPELTQSVIGYFMKNYIYPVFPKSSESSDI